MDEPLTPKDEEIQAIERIASSRDGMLLHRYLRRILESCRLTDDANSLQRHEGARMLARDLMTIMAKSIEHGIGRPAPADTSIIPAAGKPIAARRIAGHRRVAPDPAVAAFIAQHAADAEP